jgi:hypothetical protein
MGYWDHLGERDEEERHAVGPMDPTWRRVAALVVLATCLIALVALTS